MTLECKSLFRGEQRAELTPTTVKYERRSVFGRHSFEAPLSEVSPTFEAWRGTAFGSYFTAVLCVIGLLVQFIPPSDISPWSFIWAIPLMGGGVYFFFVGRTRSGSYSVIRSTKETSRDMWLCRAGREAEVDRFLSDLRERLPR